MKEVIIISSLKKLKERHGTPYAPSMMVHVQRRVMEEQKKRYEMPTIFSPAIDEGILDTHIAKVENLITSVGGEMVGKDIWGLRTLAYQVKKHDSGYYVFYYFDAEPTAPHKIRDALMLNENVIRHMIVISEHMPESIEKGGEDATVIGEI